MTELDEFSDQINAELAKLQKDIENINKKDVNIKKN